MLILPDMDTDPIAPIMASMIFSLSLAKRSFCDYKEYHHQNDQYEEQDDREKVGTGDRF
jgi:hypothetical protein